MNTPIIRSIPAASKLRKVSGFDPLVFLRLATSESGQKIVKLELPYKRLWFRMACPGRQDAAQTPARHRRAGDL